MGGLDDRKFVVLIADPDLIVRSVAVAMLDGQGYVVLSAASSHDAVQLVRQFPGEIHVALCDIGMVGPRGVSLRQTIIDIHPETRVVVLSGDTSFLGNPAQVLTFPKPFTMGQLRQLIWEMLQVNWRAIEISRSRA